MNRFIKTNSGYINADQIASFRVNDNDDTVITLKNGEVVKTSGDITGEILRDNVISDCIVVALDEIGTQLTLIGNNIDSIENSLSALSASMESVTAYSKYGDFVRIGGIVQCEQ